MAATQIDKNRVLRRGIRDDKEGMMTMALTVANWTELFSAMPSRADLARPYSGKSVSTKSSVSKNHSLDSDTGSANSVSGPFHSVGTTTIRPVLADRRDAVKLARLHRSGELTAIRVPDTEQEGVRDLVRAREDVRKDLVAAKHRLSKFLLRHGRIFSETAHWSQKHWTWIRAQVFDTPAELTTFEHYILMVEHLEERRLALEKEIHCIAQTEPYRAPVARLACLRGISIFGAMVLLAELLDLKRFDSPRQLMAFVGLVPSEYSSGGTRSQGGITKTGNSHVRRILIEASWSYRHRPALGPRARQALAGQPPQVAAVAKKAQQRLHGRYTRLVSRGKKSQVAVTAIARELCGFIWAIENRAAAA